MLGRTQERLSQKRLWMLVRMLKAGETTKAWELYDGLLGRGYTDELTLTLTPTPTLTLTLTLTLTRYTDEYHLTAMMRACPGTVEQRALVSRAELAGVKTDVPTFTFLLSGLRLEGRMEEAEALQREMARLGIEPNQFTDRVLGRTAEELSRQQP